MTAIHRVLFTRLKVYRRTVRVCVGTGLCASVAAVYATALDDTPIFSDLTTRPSSWNDTSHTHTPHRTIVHGDDPLLLSGLHTAC